MSVTLELLGFYTRKQAEADGMTHEGYMHGLLPCYAWFDKFGVPTVYFKHVSLYLIDRPISWLYLLACNVSGKEPHFMMKARELK